jgi:hypothetical protein
MTTRGEALTEVKFEVPQGFAHIVRVKATTKSRDKSPAALRVKATFF